MTTLTSLIPERYRFKISEVALRLEHGSLGACLPRRKFVRGAWALWAFLSVVAVLVLLLIVMNTGRSRFLALRPCRGMTPDQIEAWLAPRINLWARKREPKP